MVTAVKPTFICPYKETLAWRMGETVHVSPLLARLRHAGLASKDMLIGLAIQRGCRHYSGYADIVSAEYPEISDEELAIALMHLSNAYDPGMLRVAAQMSGSCNCDPNKLARLATQERCWPVLRYIAKCGRAAEPNNEFWDKILKLAPAGKKLSPGVMPHPSRFRSDCGITNPYDPTARKSVWLRPQA